MHERIGERRLSNRFGWMEVVKWENSRKVTVKFDDHEKLVLCQWHAFDSGLVTAYPHAEALTLNLLKSKSINLHLTGEVTGRNSKVNCLCTICGNEEIRGGYSIYKNPYCTKCVDYNLLYYKFKHISEPYTYDEYVGAKTVLNFVCEIHGDYSTTLERSKDNIVCNKCTVEKSRLDKCIASLNNLDNISFDCLPTRVDSLLNVICTLHNHHYTASPTILLSKYRGCKVCIDNKVYKKSVTFEVFKERARCIKGYTYDAATWKSIAENLDITHLDCGRTFSQQASTHISGNYGKPVGCPYCATHGFSLGRNGSVYVLYEETLGLTKVGVTHQPVHRRVMQIRANSLRKYNVDINFKLLQSWEMSGEECSRVEKGAHKYLSERFESPSINFDGSTECFKCPPENAINFIKNF